MEDILKEMDLTIEFLKRKKYEKAQKCLVRATFYSRLCAQEEKGEKMRFFNSLAIQLEQRLNRLEQKYKLN
jgi:hypothetical protein